jgi:capsular polysaccharide export protein
MGVYYDADRPSRLEAILQETRFSDALLTRASALRGRLVEARISKYNLWRSGPAAPAWPVDRLKLLVVGQVEDDKSILRGCADIRTNLALIEAARTARPDAFLIYKPHPDVEAGNRIGAIAPSVLDGKVDATATGLDIDACIGAVDGLATMTSLAGFEALMRGKPVWTFGRPFFAGWGLTTDHLANPRRNRRLALDELVAGALILYPFYVHPASGLPCEAEDLVDWLENQRRRAEPAGPRRWRYARAVWESLSPGARGRY